MFGLSCRGHIDLGPPKDDACDEHNDDDFDILRNVTDMADISV